MEVDLHVILILALGAEDTQSISCFDVFVPWYKGADSHTAEG